MSVVDIQEFQCSSASRKFGKICLSTLKNFFTIVSVLFCEPKIRKIRST